MLKKPLTICIIHSTLRVDQGAKLEMKQTETLPAESDQPCACCGRYHRKMKKIDGLWMGSTCAEHYEHYKWDKNINSLYWHGYESQYRKVAKMFGK